MREEQNLTVTTISPWATLALDISSLVKESGVNKVITRTESVEGTSIRYGLPVNPEDLNNICKILAPLTFELIVDEKLDEDIIIKVGISQEEIDNYEVFLHSESGNFADSVKESLESVGILFDDFIEECPSENIIEYREASPVVIKIIKFFLARLGITVKEEEGFAPFDTVINLHLIDPNFVSLPTKKRYKVHLFSDSMSTLDLLKEELGNSGFERIEVHSLEEFSENSDDCRFIVTLGQFKDTTDGALLQVVADKYYNSLGVDNERYPLIVESEHERGSMKTAYIVMPTTQALNGNLPIYAGAFPERFSIKIISDQPKKTLDLEEHLRNKGFSSVERISVTEYSSDEMAGFLIHFGATKDCDEILSIVQEAVRETMNQLGADKDFDLIVERENYSYNSDIEIYIPVDGVSDGTHIKRISSPEHYNCTINYDKYGTDAAKYLEKKLQPFGFKTLEIKVVEFPDYEEGVHIFYGAASAMLIEELSEIVNSSFDFEANFRKFRSSLARDIHIDLREDVKIPDGLDFAEEGLDLGGWIHPMNSTEKLHLQKPFVEVEHDKVRIGSIILSRFLVTHNTLIPSPQLFMHYCIDENTAMTLDHIASSIFLREPCLLEGETSTSKSSSILYLASLLGQPVVRLNLNGQTDTGDLLGRWVPQSVGVELPFSTNELQEASMLLEEKSNRILDEASRNKRALTRIEVQQIMANEKMPYHPWRWQNGLIVQALINGWWIILDELNLAEPQVLERMNSLLEREPELVLYENDGSVYGPGGKPIHPAFRIFGTMNPAKYAGRVVLSPSYRNRWRGYRNVPCPDERSYFQMLRRLVFGQQPEIDILGQSWSGKTEPLATHAVLAEIQNIEEILQALVRFHVALENATGQRVGSQARIGVRRKEKYVFTRRDLLNVMDYLASSPNIDASNPIEVFRKSILRYYIGRVATIYDQRMVIELLDAAGIGPNTWTIGLGESPNNIVFSRYPDEKSF